MVEANLKVEAGFWALVPLLFSGMMFHIAYIDKSAFYHQLGVAWYCIAGIVILISAIKPMWILQIEEKIGMNSYE